MLTRPAGVTDADIARTVLDGWGLTATATEYAAVGFGSYHWHVSAGGERWFLTVDDLAERRWDDRDGRIGAAAGLAAALTTARELRDSGLEFVVAPVPTRSRHMIHPVDEFHVAALYEHVDGESGEWGRPSTRGERLAVLDNVIAVHRAPIGDACLVDGFQLPQRDALEATLTETAAAWGPGPYAERLRALVKEHSVALRAALTRYDRLVDEVTDRGPRCVPTHGEPHPGNRIATADGVVLIDWDTALLAPPERDLWMLIDEDPATATGYTERTGAELDETTLALYRLRWDLTDIALFVADLRAPHDDTQDSHIAWTALTRHLDPRRWVAEP